MKKLSYICLLLSLSACTFTHPVKGVVDNEEHERFLGTATASLLEKNASIDIVLDSGAKCSGTYPRPQSTSGGVSASGNFQCSDGRTGSFAFGGTAHGGEGFGRFNNGDKFTFVYGDSSSPEDDAAMAAGLQSLGEGMKSMSPPAPVMNNPYTTPAPRGPISCTSSAVGSSVNTYCY